MKLLVCLKIAAVAVAMAGAASAATITQKYSSFWVLGDSLSGYVGPPEGPSTFRVSNGPLWSEQIVTDFLDASKAAGSFAVPGATAGLTRSDPADLGLQTDWLLAQQGRFGDSPLVAIWIGGNDIGAFETGLSPATSVSNYASTLNDLLSAGVSDFLLFEVPDVTYTPLIQDRGLGQSELEEMSNAAANLNSAFFAVADSLLAGSNTTRIETFDLTKVAYETPEFFGAEATGPCVTWTGDVLADCSTTSFFDPFHPTALLHDYLADEVRQIYTSPVPLPAAGWMLMAGVLGLVAIKRRAAA